MNRFKTFIIPGMRKCPALHIIDAVYIAGEDWRVKYDLKERNRLLRLFVKAMAKPSQPDHVIMRVKGNYVMSLKFIYSEKATKFCKISTLLLSYVVPVKSKVDISQNFVAFSEYMNFNIHAHKFKLLAVGNLLNREVRLP